MGSHTIFNVDRARLPRLPLALAAAVVVAQAAVVLLRPREGVIDPDRVSERSYFSAGELERAHDYRGPQFALALGGMLVEGGVLALLVVRPPRALVRPWRRPLVAGAAAGAALSLVLGAALLPLAAVAHGRAREVGLSTQGAGAWLVDQARSAAVGAVMAGAGAVLLLVLQRRFPRRWWLPGAGATVLVGAAFLLLAPVVLDPLFNRFTPLPQGRTRADVLRLAREADVDVGQVYEVDASRRTTAANAYVTGLGRTKRVVLYDTLLRDFSPQEVRLVVAHELGHVHYRDVPRGLIFLALVAPAGLFAVQRLTERLAPGRAGTPAVLPATALAIGVVSLGVTTISNQLSRRVEARADTYALRLTRQPEPFVAMERRLAVQNVADPDPPEWRTFLFATHPSTLQRIGAGVAYERGAR
jgi:Zn-dependent protease with chaperone function